MPTFRLIISGLCGFVPEKPIEQLHNQVRILMADGRRLPQKPHFPVLRVTEGLVVPGAGLRAPDYIHPAPIAGADGLAFFFLADQDLTVDGAAPHELTIASSGGGKECPSKQNKEGLEWVAPMSTISPGSGKVRQDVLGSSGHSSLVGRVALTEGTLKTTGFAKDREQVALWEFKLLGGSGASTHHQALAEEVTYERDMGNTVDLITSFFRAPTDPIPDYPQPWPTTRKDGRIRLRRVGKIAVASLLNMPIPSLLDEVVVDPTKPRDPDRGFERFYELSQGLPLRRVPHVLSLCPDLRPALPSADTPLCPPSRFDPP